jgi:purine-binding chemotaxis protein CheW
VGSLAGRRGDILVYSLSGLLRRTFQKTDGGQHIVVLRGADRLWGLLVDRVASLPPVDTAALGPLPRLVVNPQTNFFQGAVKFDKELVLLLNPPQLHPRGATTPAPESSESDPRQRAAREEVPSGLGVRGPGRQLVLFSLVAPPAGERPVTFGLPIGQVAEILEPLSVPPVPGAPTFVAGIVNWRERLVPVVDLNHLLGLPSAGGSRSRLMVVRAAPEPGYLAYFVRPAIRVVRLPLASQPSTRQLPLEPALVRGVVELRKETLVIPDLRRVQ